jgi:hypothetical protein
MLKSVCLAGAAVLLLASPALADTVCGTSPVGPAIPAPSAVSGKSAEDAAKIKHEAFVQVKDYQSRLKSFRDCLITQTNGMKTQIADAKDDAAKKPLQEKMDGMQKAYDKTVDDETQVVNDYVALQTAVCKIMDCTPKK